MSAVVKYISFRSNLICGQSFIGFGKSFNGFSGALRPYKKDKKMLIFKYMLWGGNKFKSYWRAKTKITIKNDIITVAEL